MINSRKKGFTIVELVIVIAVVAILAAVLIPTFSSLVKKANLSADQQAVRQINTLLATEFATDKPETLKEVVDMLDENGYNVDALVPLTKGYSFVWNKEDNKIELVLESEIGANVETLEDGTSYINVEVKNVEELQQAILNKSDVKLTQNITAPKLEIPSEADITFDLNGFTLTANVTASTDIDGSVKSEYAINNNGILTIENGTVKSRGLMNTAGTMTIKNATIIATDAGGGASVNVKSGSLVLDNVTLIAENGDKAFNEKTNDTTDVFYEPQCIKVENGSVIANNCTFKAENSGAYAVAGMTNSNIELNNCTVIADRGCVHAKQDSTITINGGTYKQLNAEASGHVFYAEGSIIVSNAKIEAAKSQSGGAGVTIK